jgi:hypothetical protein
MLKKASGVLPDKKNRSPSRIGTSTTAEGPMTFGRPYGRRRLFMSITATIAV